MNYKRPNERLRWPRTKSAAELQFTGGPPLTRKLLTRFPLTRFLAYVRVSGGILVLVGDHSTVPLTRVSCNTVFSKSQKTRKAGTLCSLEQDYDCNACWQNAALIPQTPI